MSDKKDSDERLLQCRNRWLLVCRARGTPAPDQSLVTPFLASLPAQQQAELDHALLLCLNGREKHRELALISWAAACTRPDFLARVQTHGLVCSGAALFGAGLTLMASGWDMSARIAQLANHPEDVTALRALLVQHAPQMAPPSPLPEAPVRPVAVPPRAVPAPVPVSIPAPVHLHAPPLSPEAMPGPTVGPPGRTVMKAGLNETVLRAVPAPALEEPEPKPEPKPEPVQEPPALASTPAQAAKPARHKRQGLAPVQHIFGEELMPPSVFPDPEDPELAASLAPAGRLQVRLFGRESAHTLEVGPHRRGASFMGVQVVTIESARALPDGSGYDWADKLTVQLTPEEMPLATAVLMNLSALARFGQHGPERDKFVELRRQEGGLVLVTGQGGTVHAVPVKAGVLYYLLSLFCRAMARGLPSGSVAEVLTLVKTAHG